MPDAQPQPAAGFAPVDAEAAAKSLDALIDLISDWLPVTEAQYPALASGHDKPTVEFCIRHSALHFSKTAGRLATWVEDADHGKYAKISALENIVAAGLVNSLKLADEIGISGPTIMHLIRERYSEHGLTAQ